MLEMFRAVFFWKVSILFGFYVPIFHEHANNFQVLNLASQLLYFLLKEKKKQHFISLGFPFPLRFVGGRLEFVTQVFGDSLKLFSSGLAFTMTNLMFRICSFIQKICLLAFDCILVFVRQNLCKVSLITLVHWRKILVVVVSTVGWPGRADQTRAI